MYRLKKTLRGHTKPINSMQFSPDGELLASASCDRTVFVWSIKTGALLQQLQFTEHGSATDVCWAERHRKLALLIACADGTLHIYVKIVSQFERRAVYHPHSSAIESFTYEPIYRNLATVGDGQLKVWSIGSEWARMSLIMMTEPSHMSGNVCRSVHFFDEGKGVLICYLESHRVCAWNVQSLQPLWERQVFTRIGHSSISTDGKTLLVDNLNSGADAYAVPSMRRLRGYKSKTRVMIPKQAIFGGTDSQVVQGDDDGRVHIFDLVSGRKLQSLSHAYGMLTVPAPNGHNVKVNSTLQGKRSIQTSHFGDESHWLASASAEEEECVIKLWMEPTKVPASPFRFSWYHGLRLLELSLVVIFVGVFLHHFIDPRSKGTREQKFTTSTPIFKSILE